MSQAFNWEELNQTYLGEHLMVTGRAGEGGQFMTREQVLNEVGQLRDSLEASSPGKYDLQVSINFIDPQGNEKWRTAGFFKTSDPVKLYDDQNYIDDLMEVDRIGGDDDEAWGVVREEYPPSQMQIKSYRVVRKLTDPPIQW